MGSDHAEDDWFRAQLTDHRLRVKRQETAAAAASHLGIAGRALPSMSHIPCAGHVAVAVLAQISSSLLDAAAGLLSGKNHYAGAALLRQVVEVEYLSWAFASQKRDASDWLNSTREERLKFFAPARLRELGAQRFRAVDYWDHCEQGGHPVPRGVPLLTGDVGLAQLMLVDLLLHTWRTTDNFHSWGRTVDLGSGTFMSPLRQVRHIFNAWGVDDPLYEWICKSPPPLNLAP